MASGRLVNLSYWMDANQTKTHILFLLSILVRKPYFKPAVKAGIGAVYSRMGFLSERKELK